MCSSNQLLGTYSVADNILGIIGTMVRSQILCLMGATDFDGWRDVTVLRIIFQVLVSTVSAS